MSILFQNFSLISAATLILTSLFIGSSVFFLFKVSARLLRNRTSKIKKINIKESSALLKNKFAALPLKRQRIVIAFCIFFAVCIVLGNIIFSLIAAAVYIYIDWNIRNSKRKKFAALIDAQTIEAVTMIKNSVLAGQTLQKALIVAAEELREPIKNELKTISDQLLLGADFDKVLIYASENALSKEFKFMIDAIRLSKDSGAALSGIFDRIINCSTQRISIQNKVSALTAQGKISGTITSAIPFLIILIMYAMQPEMIVVLFNTFAGNVLLLIVIIMILTGSFIIRKLTEIKF